MQEERLNLFLKTIYSLQEEDRVTNALLLVLQHSDRSLLAHFLGQLGILFNKGTNVFIREHLYYDSHNIVDGEILLPDKFLVAIEVKIYRNQFETDEQAGAYFRLLCKRQEKKRILLLVSPAETEPPIVNQIPGQNTECFIRWVPWAQVHAWLCEYSILNSGGPIEKYLLSELSAYLQSLKLVGIPDGESDRKRLSSKLKYILGNETAEKALLHIFHFKGAHARKIAKAHNINLYAVQKQLARFEKSGILCKEKQGRTIVYYFDDRSPFCKPIYQLIQKVYDAIPLSEKQRIFNPSFKRQRK